MELTCYRNAEIARIKSYLPAATYNLALTLLSRNHDDPLFIPIRSMQFIAIFDAEEFVFIDGERKCRIDIAWQNFNPQQRASLGEPVAYEAVYYQSYSTQLIPRLYSEFPRALNDLAAKELFQGEAQVLKLPLS